MPMNGRLSRRHSLIGIVASLLGLQGCASGESAAVKHTAKQAAPMPLSDMHAHLGRAKGLAEELKANHVLLAAWTKSTDGPYIESRPDGLHQKSLPDGAKTWNAMRDELRRGVAYAKSTGLGVVLTAADVDRALAGLSSVVLAAEGTDFMQDKLALLDDAFDAGLRHLQLVHYIGNPVGDIQTEAPRYGGLSDFGRELIPKAQAKGMLIDLAHSTEPAVLQALALSSKPMIWSHSWVDKDAGAFDNRSGWLRRRLSLATARKIADAGGVVGVWGFGLKTPNRQWPVGRNDPQGYAQVIRALIDQLGADHVALGTDLHGVGESASVKNYSDVRRVIQALQDGGLDETSVAKVSFQNYARVLKLALG